ncbi:LytR/AlgR family response regulator transcription factor [Ancylobacter defluvii]|uniref:LytR/AlgR family response regulator transcription factor n=1 Tax=Ancylobacter defluvii TaxID=1282440 RepID=UPI0022F28B00|nr:LytTR family DNA-binding domain-containing protein [Ancylobacter defluvii]
MIADDEPLARRAMRRLLAARPRIEIVGEAESVSETLEVIGRARPDLIFLDIRLNGGDGFELLAAMANAPKVIFVTAYAEYAVEAFAVDAVDYLLKPVTPERLDAAIDRVERLLEAETTKVGTTMELRSSSRVVFAAPADIVAVRAEGDFSHFFLAQQPSLMVLGSVGQFQAMLPSPPFFRIGRSIIINRDRLRRVDTRSRDEVRLTLLGMADPLIIGRAAAARLREAMGFREV